MARSLHVRIDNATEAALDSIRAAGVTDSEAVRFAIVEAAGRAKARAALAAEAATLAADQSDLREVRALQDHLDELSPPRPAD